MAKTRKLIVDVIADASKFTKELTKADGYSKRLKGSMVALGKSMALGVGAAGVAAAAFGKSALDAAIEAEKAQKGVEATIKSTGGAAGVTAKQIDKFASKMQFKTGIDDEAIKKSQSLLLAFGAVRNESGKGNAIFNRASVAMLDLGKKLGSTDSAAKALGRALTDPVAGLKGLRGAGVSLNEAQKETIKNLVESGDLLGAQKIVLAEVEKATGGYAESQVTAGDRAKLAFSEIQEKIGAGLLPVAERLSTWVVDTLIPAVQKFWKTHGPKIVAVFNDLKKAVEKIADTLGPVVVAALREFGKFVKDNSAAIATGIGIVAVALGGYAIAAGASAIASFAAAAGAVAMQIALSPTIGTIALVSAAILGMLAALAATGDLFPFLRDATKGWVDRIKAIPDGFRAVWRELIPIANDIVGVVEGFVNRSIDAINLLIRGINAIKPGDDIGEIRRITIARFEQTGIPETPYLRRVGRPFGEGGIVTRATDAIVGERGPEAIIPLERLGIGRPAAPTNINITVNASPLSNPAEVGAAVVDALKAYERRNGAIPVKVA